MSSCPDLTPLVRCSSSLPHEECTGLKFAESAKEKLKGSAAKAEGKAEGTAEKLKGQAKGAAAEAEGKAKGAAENIKEKL